MSMRIPTARLIPASPRKTPRASDSPSRPTRSVGDRHLHEMGWGGYTMASVQEPEIITLSERLAGVRWSLVGAWLDGSRTFTEVVALHDGMFLEMIRLDHDGHLPEAHCAVLDTVVKSVRPIPPLRVAPSQSALAFMVE